MFTLENVRYLNILDVPTLTLGQHPITTIVGESGSGKTTLLRLLNKMISPTTGVITFKGQDITNMDSLILRRKVPMLSQNTLMFEGDLEHNLQQGRLLSEKQKASKEQLQNILTAVHLNKPLTQDINNLSGGEKQRIALARILLLDPIGFLLDEPASALDQNTEHLVTHDLIQWIRKEKKFLIMVTHSNDVATKFSDYIISLKEGSILHTRAGGPQ